MASVIKITREQKAALIEDFQQYLQQDHEVEMGNLAAEAILDRALSLVTPYVYNQAIEDARKVILQQFDRSEEEMNLLLRPTTRRSR